MAELSHDDVVEMARKASRIIRSFITSFERRGVPQEDFRLHLEEALPMVREMVRWAMQQDVELPNSASGSRPLPGNETGGNDADTDQMMDLYPEFYQWASDKVVEMMLDEMQRPEA